MLPWFTKYPNQNDEILNLDWVIRQVENLKAAYEAFLAANSLTFADPIVWDITKQYSKNTIVLSPEGDAFLSKKAVGAGIQLNNTEYWLEIFNFAEYVRTANSNLTMHIEQNTTRATAAYAVDDWLLWEDVLYKVTAAIAVDDLLTVGTNIVHFTVEDFCRAWQTYMVNTIAQYKADIDASELLYKQQLDGTVLQYKNDIDASELNYKNDLSTYVGNTISDLQQQLDQAIAGVTVDSEVINSRIDMFSITRSTLRDAMVFDDTFLYMLSGRYNDLCDNFYNESKALHGYDIVTSTGKIIVGATYKVSDKIYMDNDRRINIINSSYKYLYCYAADDTFLGRFDVTQSTNTPHEYNASTSYFRVLALNTDSNVIVCYYDNLAIRLSYEAYNPYKNVTDLLALHENNKLGNLYNPDTNIDNYIINYSTGVMTSSSGEFMTDKIFIDSSKEIIIKGSTFSSSGYQYGYCFDYDGTYIGRYDFQYGGVPNTLAGATVAYIRVMGTIGDNLIIIQGNFNQGFKSINKYLSKGNITRRKFRLFSFNCGEFGGTGISHDTEADFRVPYLTLFSECNYDIGLFQYDVNVINGVNVFNKILSKLNVMNRYRGSSDYNYSSFSSNFDVQNEGAIDYSLSDVPVPRHTYYQYIDVIIDGVLIHIVNVHLDWFDKYTRIAEIEQIISDCSSYNNVIIAGDFNPDDYINGEKQSSNLTYESDNELFTDAGYTNLNANNSLYGVINTIADSSDHGPYDNIFIKGNIQLCGFGRIERGWMNDHYPVYADLIITE